MSSQTPLAQQPRRSFGRVLLCCSHLSGIGRDWCLCFGRFPLSALGCWRSNFGRRRPKNNQLQQDADKKLKRFSWKPLRWKKGRNQAIKTEFRPLLCQLFWNTVVLRSGYPTQQRRTKKGQTFAKSIETLTWQVGNDILESFWRVYTMVVYIFRSTRDRFILDHPGLLPSRLWM